MQQSEILKRLFQHLDKAPVSEHGRVDNRRVPRFVDFYPLSRGSSEIRERLRVMVVGADFGTVEYVEKLHQGTIKDRQTTRKGVVRNILNGIAEDDVFFTNFHPYLRIEGKATGYHPMWDDEDILPFVKDHFRLQVTLIQPKLVILLGVKPAWGAATVFHRAHNMASIRCRDATPTIVDGEPYWTSDGIEFVTATHPSYYQNSRLRIKRLGKTETGFLKERFAFLDLGEQ